MDVDALNIIVICPDRRLRNALATAIAEASAITPVMKCDTESAQRLHYSPGTSEVIINTASERMHALLGRHRVAVAVRVENQTMAAHKAQDVFTRFGFDSTVETHAEPEFPEGFLAFVSVPALDGVLLMFWPRAQNVTTEVRATLPPRLPCAPVDWTNPA